MYSTFSKICISKVKCLYIQDVKNIKEGFKIDRTLTLQKQLAEYYRYQYYLQKQILYIKKVFIID